MLKEKGIDEVFISSHIPEMNKNFMIELHKVCNLANSMDMKVILDISKKVYEQGNIPQVYALRLDCGFTKEDILRIYKEGIYHIELNASTISLETLNYLKKNGMNLSLVRISHNFYPKKYTGLSYEDVISKNIEYHKLGMTVSIYIPSQTGKRPPMYEGLPTVEKHRNMLLPCILSTIKYLHSDGIFFGDAYASKEELEYAKNYDFDVVTIPIAVASNLSVYEKDILKRMFVNRIDENESFVRASSRSFSDILPNNVCERKKFSVTIDNVKFGRYQGEVGIMKTDLQMDERVNVVGKAICDEYVLKAIKGSIKFKFEIFCEYD